MKSRSEPLTKLFAATTLTVGLVVFAGQGVGRADPQPERPLGDVQVLAGVPNPPGLPEGIAVNGHTVYVAGPASFDTAGTPPSKVFAFDTRSGELERTYTIQGENLNFPHANSCIAFDDQERLYVLNYQLGIVRLNLDSGQQEIYAPPVPDLPPCGPNAPADACSPTPVDTPPLPNDIAFDAAGNAYVTDSFQATIWRIPAGGGQNQIWFRDSRLATAFGPNGIRINPSQTKVYFSVTADGVGPQGNFLGGEIYTLPLVNAPQASDLHVFHTYNGDAPDGMAFGKEGALYVMLAAPFNSGISVLGPNGAQIARLGNTNDPIFPYDSPANGAFDKHGSLLLTNHAFATLIPSHYTVLSVFVDDKGLPLVRPHLP